MKIKNLKQIAILLVLLFGASGCENETVPRPEGYFRIDLPEKEYQLKDFHCPFTFEIPKYSFLELKGENTDEPCWFNINFPRQKAKVYVTYKPVGNNLKDYIEEAYVLTSEHQVKAFNIQSMNYVNDSAKVYGLIYKLSGNVASQVQFYLTDSTDHFVRGALYFETRPNSDSLAPVVDFITKDIENLMESFSWKDK